MALLDIQAMEPARDDAAKHGSHVDSYLSVVLCDGILVR
jgi:hypothetical protein